MEDGGSELKSSQDPALTRDESSCGLCDHKLFTDRGKLYQHYSISHFWKPLKQFINDKKKSCNICGFQSKFLKTLVCHVGTTHEKVEQFLDPSLHVPKGKRINQKHFDQECSLCCKQFPSMHHLKYHLTHRHFKEELKQFIDEDQLRCKICQSKSANKYLLRVHVGIVHKKLDEIMEQTSKIPRQTGIKQSLDQQDLELSIDEDTEEPEFSQKDVTGDEESRESEFNREDNVVGEMEGMDELTIMVSKDKERSKENSPSASPMSPVPSINYELSFRNKTKTREDRKMESIMKAIEAMEKKEARKRKDSEEKGKLEQKRGRSMACLPTTGSDQMEAPDPAEPVSSDDLEDIDCLLYDSEDQE